MTKTRRRGGEYGREREYVLTSMTRGQEKTIQDIKIAGDKKTMDETGGQKEKYGVHRETCKCPAEKAARKREGKARFVKMWKQWLMDIHKAEVEIAREEGVSQQAFNAKMRNATIRYTELAAIVERYGYTVEITKKKI